MSKKSAAMLLRGLHKQMGRENQGPVEGPYWIVMNLSRHKSLTYKPPSFPFRHPTEQAAKDEAERLAALPKHAGWRFGVFAYTGISAKVPAPAPTEPVRAESELQAA